MAFNCGNGPVAEFTCTFSYRHLADAYSDSYSASKSDTNDYSKTYTSSAASADAGTAPVS